MYEKSGTVQSVYLDYNEGRKGVSNVSGPAEPTNAIEITVNGVPRQVPGGATVLSLLEFLSIEGARVAIERNRAIVRRPVWPDTRIEQGDQLEIVQFVGGG